MKKIWMALAPLMLILSLGGLTGCIDDDDGGSGPGGGGDPTPIETPAPPGGTGTTVIGSVGFCAIGDAATMTPDSSGQIRFALPPVGFQDAASCSNGDDRSTLNDEYTFVMFNSTSGNYAFSIDQPDDTTPPSAKLAAPNVANLKAAFSQAIANNPMTETTVAYQEYLKNSHNHGANPTNWPYSWNNQSSGFVPPLFANGDVVGDEFELRFPSHVDELNVCTNTSGFVRVIGTNAKIVVSRFIPYDNVDTSPDCSVNNILCLGALQRLSSVIDSNLVPLITTLAGSYSDIDADGRFTVFITEQMNEIPLTDGDPLDLPLGVPDHGFSMTTDLLPFDPITNPCSNEQETIFIHAPDPNGYFNAFDPVSLASYLSADAFGAVAFQLEKLVSFNQHVLVNANEPEEGWLSNALGMAFVDMAGFYSNSEAFMYDLAFYLDMPSYISLTTTRRWHDDPAQGFQYLFGRFLFDSQMDSTVSNDSNGFDTNLAFLPNLYGTLTGIDNLTNALNFTFLGNAPDEFTAMFQFNAIAMVVAGTVMEQSGTTFPYYKPQNTALYGSGVADATGSTRAGANGVLPGSGGLDDDTLQNPFGINLNGDNDVVAAGTIVLRFLFENPDHFTYAPGNDFDGFTAPLAFHFVRAGGLFEQTSNFFVNFSNNNGLGFVIRRPDIDPLNPIVHSESVFGSLDPTRESIDGTSNSIVGYNASVLAAGATAVGKTLTIVGKIAKPDFVVVVDSTTGDISYDPIPDIDFYNITIPAALSHPGGDNVAAWLEKQVDPGDTGGTDGGATLVPMLVVASSDDVPDLAVLTNQVSLPRFRYVISRTLGLTTVILEDTEDSILEQCGPGPLGTPPFDYSPAQFPYSIGWAAFGVKKHVKDLFVLLPNQDDSIYDTSSNPPVYYEPRHLQEASLDCNGDPADDSFTDGDDFIGLNETKGPATMQEQILTYMARERSYVSATVTFTSTHPLTQDGTEDTLAVDLDSRDIGDFVTVDLGNHIGGYSVKNTENSVLQTGTFNDELTELIWRDVPAGGAGTMNFNLPAPGGRYLHLTPGQTYTFIVAGAGNTLGRYELKLRKFDTSKIARSSYIVIIGQ